MTLATTAVGRPPFDVGLVPDHQQSSTATQRSAFYVTVLNRHLLYWRNRLGTMSIKTPTLFMNISTGVQFKFGATMYVIGSVGSSSLLHLETSSSIFPASLVQSVLFKALQAEIINDFILLLELHRSHLQSATVLCSLYLMKRLSNRYLYTESPEFDSPAKQTLILGLKLVAFSSQSQLFSVNTTINPQKRLSALSNVNNSDQVSTIYDGANLLTTLGQHWYEFGPLGFILQFDCGSGLSDLNSLMTHSDSLIRSLIIMVGILFSCLYLSGLVLGLGLPLGGLFDQANLSLVVNRVKLSLSFPVSLSPFYEATSLSDAISRSRESLIYWLLLQSVVIPEWCPTIRRFIASLERTILFQTVQRRAIDLDSLRLPPMLDSLECILHLSLREFGCTHTDTPLFSSILEALLCIAFANVSVASLCMFLSFVIVIGTYV